MPKIISLIATILFFQCSFLGAADVALDSYKIKVEKGNFQVSEGRKYEGEPLFEILYDGQVIFEVLERFLPEFNYLIVQAKESNGKLYRKNNKIVSFTRKEDIEQSFYVLEKQESLAIRPGDLTFKIKRSKEKKFYYVSIKEGDNIKISHELYNYLIIFKGIAQKENRGIELNLNIICDREKADSFELKDCVTLMDKPIALELECCICMDAKKSVLLEPCNHVCLCEACAKIIKEKKCPICEKNYTNLKKIYL